MAREVIYLDVVPKGLVVVTEDMVIIGTGKSTRSDTA